MIAEAFRTQDEPAFCGLGTLVTVLNALEVDPGSIWKGSWRWYAETMLECCVDLEEVKANGIAWAEWLCIARCQGLQVDARRAEDSTIEDFRAAVRLACESNVSVLCVAYGRGALGQVGDGHYSPIGAFSVDDDHVLIMDVARFKHPPHWVPLERLWDAVNRPDKATGRSRGFALLARSAHNTNGLLQLTFGRGRLQATRRFFADELEAMTKDAASLEEELWAVARGLPAAVAALVSISPPEAAVLQDSTANSEDGDVAPGNAMGANADAAALAARREAARQQLEATAVYRALLTAEGTFRKRDGPLPASISAIAGLLLVAGGAVGDAAIALALPRATALGLVGSSAGAHDDPQGAELAAEVRTAVAMLHDMSNSSSKACDEERSCCNERQCDK